MRFSYNEIHKSYVAFSGWVLTNASIWQILIKMQNTVITPESSLIPSQSLSQNQLLF